MSQALYKIFLSLGRNWLRYVMALVYSLSRIDSRGVRSRDCGFLLNGSLNIAALMTYFHKVQDVERRTISLEQVIEMEGSSTIERIYKVHYDDERWVYQVQTILLSISGFGVTPVLSCVQYRGILPRCCTYDV